MKKIFTLILGITLAFSCSTSTDENGNSNTTVVPLPPSGLTGSVVSPTQINLTFTDNSTNETGFKIERRTDTTNYAVVGTVNQDVLNFSDSGLTPSTTYTYRVYAFNAVGNSLTYTNEVTLTTSALLALPTLTTTAASSITQTAASSGGNISNDGGAAIIARGVCWSTSANPTIALTTKTSDGTGIGAFTSNITGLSANTTYYVRAYAINSQGTAYGNEVSFITLQNAIVALLPNVTIGNQIWSSTNLDVTTYRDGTPIPQVTDPTQWASLTTGAWCYNNNDPANGTTYGKLYNWYAAAGIHDTDPSTPNKILAPQGWHIPSDAEWTSLTTFLGGESVAGGKMKATGTIQAGTGLWQQPNTDATNASGFTGLPGGFRTNDGTTFFGIGFYGYWWSSSESSTTGAWYRRLGSNAGIASRINNSKNCGFSVRCLRD
jgi:uncharacterized protein (TIGR02145 family)